MSHKEAITVKGGVQIKKSTFLDGSKVREQIEIVIPGAPIACKRPRLSGNRFYDSQIEDKRLLAFQIKMALETLPMALESIKITLEYQMTIPASFSNVARLKCLGKHHSRKPDLSNLIKFTEDALNGILWRDDALISEIQARKIYSNEPKTILIIEPILENQ